MTEDLMESVAPMLAPPVTRQPVNTSAANEDNGVGVAGVQLGPLVILFAADDDE